MYFLQFQQQKLQISSFWFHIFKKEASRFPIFRLDKFFLLDFAIEQRTGLISLEKMGITKKFESLRAKIRNVWKFMMKIEKIETKFIKYSICRYC